VPKPFPPEFRRDVIAVARKGEASISHVARDFGISESCLQRWLKIADREDGLARRRPRPVTAAQLMRAVRGIGRPPHELVQQVRTDSTMSTAVDVTATVRSPPA
jgi:transposase-like protein